MFLVPYIGLGPSQPLSFVKKDHIIAAEYIFLASLLC